LGDSGTVIDNGFSGLRAESQSFVASASRNTLTPNGSGAIPPAGDSGSY